MTRVRFPRIGSFVIDDRGLIRLENRPLTLEIQDLENDGIPLDIPRARTYCTVDAYVDALLSCHDSRLQHQPNAVNDAGDCVSQMCALVLLCALRPRFFDPKLNHGPFAPGLTDLNFNNIIVDDDWNITCIIDLEWTAVLPLEFIRTPCWLTSQAVDEIDVDHYNKLREEFMEVFEKEERRLGRYSDSFRCSSIMNTTWKLGTFWCEDGGLACVPHEAIKRTVLQKRVRGRFARTNANAPLPATNGRAECLPNNGEESHYVDSPPTSRVSKASASIVGADTPGTFGRALLRFLEVREPSPGRWAAVQDVHGHQCSTFLDRYKDMIEAVPLAIHVPPSNLDDLLSSSPTLLLAAILTGSSADSDFEKQAGEVFRHVLADRVIVRGQKSMELLQSLLTYMMWYHHRFDPETLQYYQLLQLANGMVADLGLPRRFATGGNSPPREDEDLNAMRAFLLCYYINCSGGVLGYDRPENMRCTESLRNAAKVLAEVSSRPQDKEAPALVELMHFISLHRVDFNQTECRVLPTQSLTEWKTAYLRAETSMSLRSTYYFVAGYTVLKSSSSMPLSVEDALLCVEHFETLLSHILSQELCYLVRLGTMEWSHLITTLFRLARLERSRVLESDTADASSLNSHPSLTNQYVGRFRTLMADLLAEAETDTALKSPHLMGWLDKILTAVAAQQVGSWEVSQDADKDEDVGRHDEESAYELVNSFIDEKGRVRDSHNPKGSNPGRLHDEEGFWTDFMSDWLNW
ncbi:Transcriptional regulator WAR1 [Fonsecaea erecta]|uniref:Transcriptional regulator WAR1 n=1 Tax=Fonsecaea erecta TaxID=1367422 RepID=A0A178ZXA4_9EURO|nr:Transcriptional regulator WAR1 [Fonsecaea erecta]OAP64468.1 Transcriptional regulator WAR1 [Fonsecaea erecta]